MDFIKDEWLVPSEVETPNIEEDIQQYLGDKILEKWRASTETDIKKTIVFITERLDFISQLNEFRKLVIKNSVRKAFQKDEEIWVSYNFVMDGHDYSGVQFDIEALVLYLLMTCIDAIQTQPKYHSAFDWLRNNVAKYEHQTKENIIDLLGKDQAEYDELYGLSKNFRLAFIDGISERLRSQISENIIVARFGKDGINEESFTAWVSRKDNEKIKKIANFLYHLRSKYTHNNIRSFMPQKPYGARKLVGEYLLCKQGFSLERMLEIVIKELCLSKLN